MFYVFNYLGLLNVLSLNRGMTLRTHCTIPYYIPVVLKAGSLHQGSIYVAFIQYNMRQKCIPINLKTFSFRSTEMSSF